MSEFDSKFWDERYSATEYVYGTDPNKFFKEQLDKIPADRILLLGEGEGRNAVYAAKNGWNVYAIDYSDIARQKALSLAKKSGVNINYETQDLKHFDLHKEKYNAVAIIFLHLEPQIRKQLHQKIITSLSSDGFLIMEVYEKEQLGKSSGGPQDFGMLYSLDELKTDFSELKTLVLKKEIIELNEGNKHKGDASVIRYVGKKISYRI